MPGFNLPDHVTGRDFDDTDEGEGSCPTCGGPTCNGEADADEDGEFWTWKACDKCKAPCGICEEEGTEKDEAELCQDCGTLSSWPWACRDCWGMDEGEPCEKHADRFEPDPMRLAKGEA